MKKRDKKLHAVVCPEQKLVKIKIGQEVVKTYSFKRDVPSEMVDKVFHGYDYGAWSVSDRDYTYTKKVKVWDEAVMKEIREETLKIYNETIADRTINK